MGTVKLTGLKTEEINHIAGKTIRITKIQTPKHKCELFHHIIYKIETDTVKKPQNEISFHIDPNQNDTTYSIIDEKIVVPNDCKNFLIGVASDDPSASDVESFIEYEVL